MPPPYKSLLPKAFLNGSVKIGEIFSYLFVTSLLTRTLATEEFGLFALLCSGMPFLAVFCALGLPTYLVKVSGRGRGEEVLESQLTLALALISAFSFIITICYLLFDFIVPTQIEVGYLVFVVTIGYAGAVNNLFAKYLSCKGQTQLSMSVLPQNSGGLLVCIVYFIIWCTGSIEGLADALYYFALSFMLVVLSIAYWIHSHYGFKRPLSLVAPLKKIGVAPDENNKTTPAGIWLHEILTIIGVQLDIWIVGICFSSAVVGEIALSQRISGVFALPFFVVNLIAPPIIASAFARGELRASTENVRKLVLVFFILSAAAFTVFLVFGGQFVPVIFGPEYSGIVWIIAALTIAKLAAVFAGPNSFSLTVSDNQKSLVAIQASVVIFKIFLMPVAIFSFGILGYLIVSILISLSRTGALIYFSKRLVGLSFHASWSNKS